MQHTDVARHTRAAARAALLPLGLALLAFLVACGGQPTPSAPTTTRPAATAIQGGGTVQLDGTGATFPLPLYKDWFENSYSRHGGARVLYQGTGSSEGKKAIVAKTVDFAGSDAPMTDQELTAGAASCGAPIMHFPTAVGGVVIAYNLPELVTAPLRLDGETLARIFLGTVTRWDDPALAALNTGVRLPSEPIAVIHRADGSGTSDIFTSYLATVSPTWRDTVGSGTTVKWPTGTGATGGSGVATALRGTPYGISYLESTAAQGGAGVGTAAIRNRAGKFVNASVPTLTAAATAGTANTPADLRVKFVDADGAESYPLAGLTWLLVCPNQTNEAKALALTQMLWWVTHEGQKLMTAGYAPLPPALIAREETMVNAITVNGVKAYAGK